MITIKLPYPPSANKVWRTGRGVTFLSKEATAFRKEVALVILGLSLQERSEMPFCDALTVSIRVYPPDKRQRDIDNLLKPTLDALEHAGVYVNDNLIECLTIKRLDVAKPGFIEVDIFPTQDL